MRGFIRGALVLGGLLLASVVQATPQQFSIPLDVDATPSTGCPHAYPDTVGGAFTGADFRILWSAPRSGDDTVIESSQLQRCVAGRWEDASSELSVTAPTDEGITAFSLSLSRADLGTPDALTLAVAATDDDSGGDVLDRAGINPIVWVLDTPAVPIPVLSAWLLAVLVIALAAIALRRGGRGRTGAALSVLALCIAFGVHLGAVHAGEKPDLRALWAGIAPLATDTDGDAQEPGPDLLSLSAQLKDSDVHLLVRARPVNHAPAFTSTPPADGQVGDDLAYIAVAEDPDDDLLHYALESGPAGATLDATSGLLSWIPAEDGDYAFILTATDPFGASDTQTFTVTVGDSSGGSNQPPQFTTVPPTTATVDEPYTYTPAASDPDDDPVTFALEDGPTGMALDGDGVLRWTPLEDGTAAVSLSARDGRGGEALQNFSIVVGEGGDAPGNQPPAFTSTPEMFTQIGQAYRYAPQVLDPDGDTVTVHLIHGPAGLSLDGDGALGGTLGTEGQSLVVLEARDAHGAATQQRYLLAALDHSTLPPDPADTATDLGTTDFTPFEEGIRFLYSGANPVQIGVAPDTISEVFAAVINGQVQDRAGQPIPGVQLTVLNHPEYGSTRTRADGEFDLVVNGGDTVVLTYTKPGYLPVQRKVPTQWQSHARAPDVVMIPLSEHAAVLDTSGAATDMQVYRGRLESDESGSRRATVLIPAGTRAELEHPDGSRAALTTMTLRATEYTVGDTGPRAMPGPLPYNVGYTYAVELSADEAIAAGAAHVRFDRPVAMYVDNFLDFPVGEPVPLGWYDYADAAWRGEQDGLIVRVLNVENGQAVLELGEDEGPASAQDLAELGISQNELNALAELYQAGDTVWRVHITHLTPWDCNWPMGPPNPAEPPTEPPLTEPETPPCADCSCVQGCEIDTMRRSVSERISINGTPLDLVYHGNIASFLPRPEPGQAPDPVDANGLGRIFITAIKESVPDRLLHAEVSIKFEGAGIRESRRFSAEPEQYWNYQWDGYDRYGRPWYGSDEVAVTVTYVYPLQYYSSTSRWEAAWGQFALGGYRRGGGSGGGSGGGGVGISVPPVWLIAERTSPAGVVRVSRTWDISVQSPSQKDEGNPHAGQPVAAIAASGGWTYSLVHSYESRTGMLYLGSGGVLSAHTLGPALQKQSDAIGVTFNHVAIASDEGLYFIDEHRILKRSTDGKLQAIAGKTVAGYEGDGGPASQSRLRYPRAMTKAESGDLLFVDQAGSVARRVGVDGLIHTIAGGGTSEFTEAGGVATEFDLSISRVFEHGDGSVWVVLNTAEGYLLARLDQSGVLRPVSGVENAECVSEYEIAREIPVSDVCFESAPVQVEALQDGRLLLAFDRVMLRLNTEGLIERIAGSPSAVDIVDRIKPAEEVSLSIKSILPLTDGGVYLITGQTGGHSVVHLTQDGMIYPLSAVANGRVPTAGLALGEVQFGVGSVLLRGGDGFPRVVDADSRVVWRLKPAYPTYDGTETLVPSRAGGEVYVFNPKGRHLRTIDALTGAEVLSFEYDSAGRLSAVTDMDGNVTRILRGVDGFANHIVGPDDRGVALNFHPNGTLRGVANDAGHEYLMEYTSTGLLASFQRPNGRTNKFTYDDYGRLSTDEDDVGGGWVIEDGDAYSELADTLLQGNTFTSGEGRSVTFARDRYFGRRNTASVIEYPDGQRSETYWQFDDRFVNQAPRDATVWGYRKSDPVLGSGTPRLTPGGVTLGDTTASMSSTSEAVLSDPDDPLSLVSRLERQSINGRTFEQRYERATGVIQTQSAQGRIVEWRVDHARRPLSIAMPNRASIDMDYDARGRLRKLSSGESETYREYVYEYHADGPGRGLLASVTDPVGRMQRFDYDTAGRLVTQTLPDDQIIRFSYDASGNLTSLAPPGRPAHLFEYEPRDEMSAYQPPEVVGLLDTATRYHYNLDRQLTAVDRPDGEAINFHYDKEIGRLTAIRTAQEGVDLSYDDKGRLTTVNTSDGIGIDYGYEGPLVTSWAWRGPVEGSVSTHLNRNFWPNEVYVNGDMLVDYRFDNDGLVERAGPMQVFRQAGGVRIANTSAINVHTGQSYNSHGELVDMSATLPVAPLDAATDVLQRLGRLEQIILLRLASDEAQYEFVREDVMPRVIRMTHGLPSQQWELQSYLRDVFVGSGYWGPQIPLEGVVEQGLFDEILSIIQSINPNETGPEEVVYWVHFQRDSIGRIVGQSGEVDGWTIPAKEYEFDVAGRLSEVMENGRLKEAYSYDANGNRLEATIDGYTVTADYDAQDRLLRYGESTYTYTANGELHTRTSPAGTVTYEYDAFGNLRHVQQPDGTLIEYLVDGAQRRIGKRVNGQMRRGWLYQDQLNPVAELDGQGSIVARFVYVDRGNVPAYMLRDGKTYRIIADHLGSPRLVIDIATGEVVQRVDYGTWGEVTLDTNPGFQPFGFAGGLEDRDTGLVRFGARDYDPETGRWTAKDPILFAGGDTNLYGYVINDPVNFIDPKGLSGQDVEKIVKSFHRSVERMTEAGDRIDPFFLNNAWPFDRLICSEQSAEVLTDLTLLPGKFDDNWTFDYADNFDEKDWWEPGHIWVEGESSNESDPKVVLDPWRNKYVLDYVKE